MTFVTDPTPRIYVACLAAYNHGVLHGTWIAADQNAWAMWDEISAMLRASPIAGAEEWAIHDYEDFKGVRLSESEDIDRVVAIAAFVVEHGALGAELIRYHGDVACARKAIDERYAGEYESLAAFAHELTEGTTAIPEALRYYIDWQAMARDLAVSDVIAIEAGFNHVHVFWTHRRSEIGLGPD